MLNFCNIIRPVSIIITSLALLSILAPGLLEQYWPYLAAVGVLLVPVMVYRWWNTRYNPGCSVRFNYADPESSIDDRIR